MRYRDRLFAGLMSLSLLAALTGCSASAPEQQIAVEVPSQQVLQADASQALVTLTIPSEYLPVQPDAGFDPTAYAVENGFADAVLEADGALTITMTQRYYDTFRAALYDAIAAQMTQATQTDYLSGLEYSEDFSSISVQANAAGYRAATDFFPSVLVHLAVTYQAYTPEGLQGCTVTVYDAETGQPLDQAHSEISAS